MHRIYGLPGLYTKRFMVLHVPCILVVCPSKPPSVVQKKKKALLPTQRCAGIRTTALACAHASGASGGSDVHIDTYIDVQTGSQLYH